MSDCIENNMVVIGNIADTFYRAELSKEIHHSTSQKLVAYMKFFGYMNIFLSGIIAAGFLAFFPKPSLNISMSSVIHMAFFSVPFFNTLIASIILYRKDGEAAHEHKITGDL
jgi:hypothetical protein